MRRKIDGDTPKLLRADGLTLMQKRLLQDFRFRTRAIPGAQEIRTKIGHIGFWASVVYGNGIFMTISPGERHNYLAIRLSRYRRLDPFVTEARDVAEKAWIGIESPSLEAKAGDTFGVDVPGYDLRRLIQARDPLCVVNAFFFQVRSILSTALGLRMCPDCPHCVMTDRPCQDALGSSAEAMGGCAGRADALCGAVECQKSSGSLHLHFWLFVQRLHQYRSLQEIAEIIRDGLAKVMQERQQSEHERQRNQEERNRKQKNKIFR